MLPNWLLLPCLSCNNTLQTGWLRTAELHSVIILGIRTKISVRTDIKVWHICSHIGVCSCLLRILETNCTASLASDHITPISASTLYPSSLVYQMPSASPLKDMWILWGPRTINPPISVCLLSSFLWLIHILWIFTYWNIYKCCVFRVSPSRKCVGNLISNAVILEYGIRCLGHGGEDVRLFLTVNLKSLKSSERGILGWGTTWIGLGSGHVCQVLSWLIWEGSAYCGQQNP